MKIFEGHKICVFCCKLVEREMPINSINGKCYIKKPKSSKTWLIDKWLLIASGADKHTSRTKETRCTPGACLV